MKYKTVCQKGEKYLIKIVLDDGTEKWADTTSAVYNYAKNNFKEGEECSFEYTVKDSKYNVTRILKDGKSTQTEAKPPVENRDDGKKYCECGNEIKNVKYSRCYDCNQKGKSTTGVGIPKCEDCGKELKDGKYKKCYDCNKKNPSKSTGKSDKTGDLIVKQAIMKASCSAISTMAGQVDNVDVLIDTIFTIYEKLLKKIYE